MVFKNIDLEWKGKTYTIPSNRILGVIAVIEERMTFQDLAEAHARKNLSLTRLARTYGDVLRYAGAAVSDDEVYAGMFDGDMSVKIKLAVEMLLAMMIPPGVLEAASGNPPARDGRAKPKPSKPRTRR